MLLLACFALFVYHWLSCHFSAEPFLTFIYDFAIFKSSSFVNRFCSFYIGFTIWLCYLIILGIIILYKCGFIFVIVIIIAGGGVSVGGVGLGGGGNGGGSGGILNEIQVCSLFIADEQFR